MEYGFKGEPVFNGGGSGEVREAQEVEWEIFKCSLVYVFPAQLLEKRQPLCRCVRHRRSCRRKIPQ
jgi:hypothetical protein